MKLCFIQNNAHLGRYDSNVTALAGLLAEIESDVLALTSSFAIYGSDYHDIASIGGFFQRIQAIDYSPLQKHTLLLQTLSSEGKSSWLSLKSKETSSFASSFEQEGFHFFAPHLSRSCELFSQEIPANTDIIYLACADVFCDGKDYHQDLQNFAKKVNIPIIYVNACGASDGIVYAGRSALFSAQGECLASLEAFQEGVCSFEFLKNASQNILQVSTPKQAPSMSANEALFQAAVCALRDYSRKTGIKKALIGMSGGMDSALVATLSCEAFGAENVLGIMMPSVHSSDHSVKDAVTLMQNLGMNYHSVSISQITDAFEQSIAPAFSSFPKLPDNVQDLTPDNLQARARGSLLMAFANRLSCMVIGTGNKSETAMGFCTLYGDTVGAIEPIADIYKTRVYDVAKWYNKSKNKEIIPQNIMDKAPSAELRPGQKDEDTLPPYPLLDRVLEQILEQGKDPHQISDPELTEEYKKIILQRLAQNEFKRKQCPLVVTLTSCSFGMGWNTPVTSKVF